MRTERLFFLLFGHNFSPSLVFTVQFEANYKGTNQISTGYGDACCVRSSTAASFVDLFLLVFFSLYYFNVPYSRFFSLYYFNVSSFIRIFSRLWRSAKEMSNFSTKSV